MLLGPTNFASRQHRGFGRRVPKGSYYGRIKYSQLALAGIKTDDDNDENSVDKRKTFKESSSSTSPGRKIQRKSKTSAGKNHVSMKQKHVQKKKKMLDTAQPKKKEIIQKFKAKIEGNRQTESRKTHTNKKGNDDKGNGENVLGKLINPFQAGRDLRQTLGSLSTLGRGLSEETKHKFYLDEQFLDTGATLSSPRSSSSSSSSSSATSSSRVLSALSTNSLLQDAIDAPKYIPEVLVVGATGEVGRLVVRRLLFEGRFQVRVLVRNLYSRTLNLLGTGVSYCQGDLSNVESLEYALTDVDKIVYVAGAPRPGEKEFQSKLQQYVQDHNLKLPVGVEHEELKSPSTAENMEWEHLSNVLELRAELAEQVDYIGMRNLLSAYQNVRFTDYGISQAAKISLFKFCSRPEDFNLFRLDDGGSSGENYSIPANHNENLSSEDEYIDPCRDDEGDDDRNDDYSDDVSDNYNILLKPRVRSDGSVKTQVQWIRNQVGNGVFFGRVPKATSRGVAGGEAAIVSCRLRSQDDPNQGIDLSNRFGGFILRLATDGNQYEAFVRTSSYETDSIEYVCEFATDTSMKNKHRVRYKTLRLAFEIFKPVQRKRKAQVDNDMDHFSSVPPFNGADVQYIGFRFRSISSDMSLKDSSFDRWQCFYIALSYIKVYRIQPEPEFVFLSDARIPPVIRSGMVQHNRRRLLTDENVTAGEMKQEDINTRTTTFLFDEKDLQSIVQMERSPEETYFKYRGEEILKSSGLSYTIIRVAGFNELPTSEASTIDLVSSNDNLVPVSRSEVAQVCVSALLDPSALNKSVYMTKKKSTNNAWEEEDISAKFDAIPSDGL